MGIPTLEGLQIALTGLNAGQESLDVIGQNIANAQTPGYTRQTAVLQTSPSIEIAALSPTTGEGAQLGTGVDVQTIARIRDSYLDAQYRNASSTLAGASTIAETLEQVQGALAEPSSAGLSARLATFWNAWNSLASSTTNAGARESVVSAGEEVAATLNALSSDITGASVEAAKHYEAITASGGEVAKDAQQIAELNTQIKLAEQGGISSPNELLDRRDQLVDELSKLASVSVSEAQDGAITVSFGDATEPLVEDATVHWPQGLTSAAGGQLGALLSLSEPEGQLAKLSGALNEVAETLAETVNALQPRAPFFTFSAGAPAASIAVTATPAQLQTGPEGEPGANDLANALAGLRGGEAESLYSAFVTRVGAGVKAANADVANAEAVHSAVADQRQSVSGVSMDEEMTNLITFQRGYEASARALTAMDQMLETLIDHTGTAGL